MTDEQKKALEILQGIEAKITELDYTIDEYKDDLEHVSGASKRRTRTKIDLLTEFSRYLTGVASDMENAFGIGWEEKSVTEHEFEHLHMPGVKFRNTTRMMVRVDGKVRYDVRISSNGIFIPPPGQKGGILGIN